MQFLMMIFAVLSGIGIWYWRIQRARDGIKIVGNAAEHLKGVYNRNKFKKQTQGSVLAGIDDARTAAAVLMVCIAAEKAPVSNAIKALIASKLVEVAGMPVKIAEESVEFGDWVVGEVSDTNTVMRKFLPLFREQLSIEQRGDLLAMANEISLQNGEAEPIQRTLLKQLREGLSN